MKYKNYLLAFILCGVSVVLNAQKNGDLMRGSKSPLLPGLVSRETPEFGTALTADGKTWEQPEPLDSTLNSPDDEVFCSLARNGNLYFARFVNRKSKIYRSVFLKERYEPAVMLALPVADTCSVSNPAISPDEKYLVFASADLKRQGAADLFACKRLGNNTWTAPENLGAPFNSSDADFAPAFSVDGKTLLFTSERPGVVRDFPAGKRRPGDLYAFGFKRP